LKLIRVGLQDDVEVSFSSRNTRPWTQVLRDTRITVSQVYAAAPAVGYSAASDETDWEPLAQLLLDAQYEATVRAAFENYKRHPNLPNSNLLYLTALGGGVFENNPVWIAGAIRRAVKISTDEGFGLNIVSGLYKEDIKFRNLLSDLVPLQPASQQEPQKAPQLSAALKFTALALICLLAAAAIVIVMIAHSRRGSNDHSEVPLEKNGEEPLKNF
jgi:hypothetical protein